MQSKEMVWLERSSDSNIERTGKMLLTNQTHFVKQPNYPPNDRCQPELARKWGVDILTRKKMKRRQRGKALCQLLAVSDWISLKSSLHFSFLVQVRKWMRKFKPIQGTVKQKRKMKNEKEEKEEQKKTEKRNKRFKANPTFTVGKWLTLRFWGCSI